MEEAEAMGKEKEQEEGFVRIADQVVAVIAGIAATEVEGISMAGNITSELIGKLGKNKLSKGVKITISEGVVYVDLTLSVAYGYSIPKTCRQVQEKVTAAVENMTGLQVADVNIKITGVELSQQ
jgi:uncharacterized alkaline shock family protein YloU